ncbi:VCBS repeat-containing protein [Nonomuraea sp. NPDC050404]|uniref:FG-GAP repeat domain-containing protein n=1 Tax=Nonomuraea sp. NPDC050404 TaxID=3155783 RepID=UPI00340BF6BA
MSSFSLRRLPVAALAALTIIGLSAPAHAAPEPAPSGDITLQDVTVQWKTAPCDPGGPTGSDAALATQLNGVLTGRLDGYMTAYKVSCARMVVKAVRDRGMPKHAAVIAVTTTIVETNIENVSEMVDHDSLGLFQQRASWGSDKNRLDPIWATNAFLGTMVRIYPNNSWMDEPVGEVCQAVQVSAHPGLYQPQASDGQKIVDALWAGQPTLHGADFDGDGVSDIFAAGTGTLTIWNGKGNNNFRPADPVGGGWGAFSRPIGGDFNGDGVGDLAAVKDGVLNIWNGRGGNRFASPEPVGSGWTQLAGSLFSAGDVNKDGRTDIGAVDPDGVLHIWNGKGNNNFAAAHPVGGGWRSLSRPVGGDFNGDGIGDLAAVDGDGVLHLWNGRGGNNFTGAQRVGGGWTAHLTRTLMSLGDVNGDRHTDLAAITPEGVLTVWNGRGENRFGPATPIGPGWNPHFPA